jgi:ribosomal protein S18 acetylase RimI-like enzyme
LDGCIKVNNNEVWNYYVKLGKVKGFSIEGYYADKIEKPKAELKSQEEIEADLLLSKIKDVLSNG